LINIRRVLAGCPGRAFIEVSKRPIVAEPGYEVGGVRVGKIIFFVAHR
jgi:hypothetical protein